LAYRTLLNLTVVTMLLAAAAPSSSLAADTAARCATDKIAPAEVAKLLQRARLCDHLAGEIGAGGERGRDVSESSTRNQCDFVDGDLAQLKKRFASNCQAMADIADYEAGRPR
jgi:hypothetical protein